MILAFSYINHCSGQSNMAVNSFIDNFENFKMDIQAAGIATIPAARLSDSNELYIEYHYDSSGEKRKGKMTLTFTKNNRYEG